MIGPLNFCRSMGWKPWQGLADYIKEVKRIQDSLTDTAFLGEVLGHEGCNSPAARRLASITPFFATWPRANAFASSPTREWNRKSRRSRASRPHKRGEVRVHTPFQKAKTVKLPAEIEIPAERIVFVEERIDDVQTVSSPLLQPLPSLPPSDPKTSLKLEDDRYLVEVNRSNGAIARIQDKKAASN